MNADVKDLISATLADDRASATRLLQRDPALATLHAIEADRYVDEIVHWFYVGDTALHVAAAAYRVEVSRWLLAAGADPDRAGNRRRSRPLHYAADGSFQSSAWDPARQVATLRLLVEGGANVNAQDRNGATPLHRAVRTRCSAAVKHLLGAGADPEIRNKPGSTPFHLAVQTSGRGGSGSGLARTAQGEILRLFLQHGVSPSLLDSSGKSVLESARSERVRSVLLGRAGGSWSAH